jgi:sugar fermentation stimulation protein A
VEEALRAGRIPELAGYDEIRREVAYDQGCRIDFLLRAAGGSAGLLCGGQERTSQAVLRCGVPGQSTARGARHLRALARRVQAGARAVMVYVVQRTDCRDFRIAADLDPAYARALGAAAAGGVESLCLACRISVDEIRLAGRLPIVVGSR